MYIAKAADGSLRDGLSLLDQCVAFHYGKLLTYENALEVLGAVDSSVFSRMFNAVADGRTRDCITELEEIVIQGRELGHQTVADGGDGILVQTVARSPPPCTMPIIKPATKLMTVIISDMTASPLTILVAPSMAP